jgi:hypothetical protein
MSPSRADLEAGLHFQLPPMTGLRDIVPKKRTGANVQIDEASSAVEDNA